MKKRILITGATGLIGSNLCRKFSERGDILTVFSRDPEKAKNIFPFANEFVKWDYQKPDEWKNFVNNKDVIIHLAGANLLGKRWKENYKKVIIESREISTRNLVNAIGEAEVKPKVFICASGINYYGNGDEKILTEESSIGNDFLANVCGIWEKEAAEVKRFNVRHVSIRTSPVLSSKGGLLKKFLTPFKFFIGGPLGSGEQWFSWIHLEDILRVYIYCIDNKFIQGAVNASSPNPVRMKDFAKTMGDVLNRPSFFRVPEGLLKLAIGEMADSALISLRVKPKKLEDNNFKFLFADLKEALNDLIK